MQEFCFAFTFVCFLTFCTYSWRCNAVCYWHLSEIGNWLQLFSSCVQRLASVTWNSRWASLLFSYVQVSTRFWRKAVFADAIYIVRMMWTNICTEHACFTKLICLWDSNVVSNLGGGLKQNWKLKICLRNVGDDLYCLWANT